MAGLSGLIGAGAADSLQTLLAQQEMARQQAIKEQQQAIENQRRDREQSFRETSHADVVRMGEQQRSDTLNKQGLDIMKSDRAAWENEQKTRELTGILDRIKADESIPAGVRQIIDFQRIGVDGIKPEDLLSDEDRSTRAKAKEDDDVRRAGRIADAQAGAAARHREPKAQTEGMSPQQMSFAKAFMDDYARDSKSYIAVRDGYQRVSTAAQRPDAAGDLSLIFGYMKMLDPNSVVRETEFANAQNAAGVPDQVRNLYNRAMSGERLNPNQRKQFVAQAQGLMAVAHQNQSKVRSTYANRSQKFGIDPAVVLDEEDPMPETPVEQRPIPGVPGGVAELRDGKWIRVK